MLRHNQSDTITVFKIYVIFIFGYFVFGSNSNLKFWYLCVGYSTFFISHLPGKAHDITRKWCCTEKKFYLTKTNFVYTYSDIVILVIPTYWVCLYNTKILLIGKLIWYSFTVKLLIVLESFIFTILLQYLTFSLYKYLVIFLISDFNFINNINVWS